MGGRGSDRTHLAEWPGPAQPRAHARSASVGAAALRLVQVRINEAEIEALERLGYLEPGLREDGGSIQKAVQALVSDTPWM